MRLDLVKSYSISCEVNLKCPSHIHNAYEPLQHIQSKAFSFGSCFLFGWQENKMKFWLIHWWLIDLKRFDLVLVYLAHHRYVANTSSYMIMNKHFKFATAFENCALAPNNSVMWNGLRRVPLECQSSNVNLRLCILPNDITKYENELHK